MSDRLGIITMKGSPLTLSGNEVKVGDEAPDFEVTNNDLSAFKFSDVVGKKIYIISAVPSLDTAVCDTETRKFNERASNLSSDIEILTISMDLPFAQKRWCGSAGIDKVKTLSDYKFASFGTAYGILIKELRLLARVVFVIDKKGVIKYIEIVKEVASEPNYDAVIKTAKE